MSLVEEAAKEITSKMVQAQQEPWIGIDLGTTNSCVGYWDPQTQTAEILSNELGFTTMPSVVAFNENGTEVVGRRAVGAENSVFDAKRLMGLEVTNPNVQKHRNAWTTFDVEPGERNRCMIKLNGIEQRVSPEEVAAKILNACQLIAKNRLQREVKKCVVTVPAYFNQTQKRATRDACTIAGLDCERIINEPTAAAMACGIHNSDVQINVLVFDMGGGTFDVSLLSIEDGMVDVLATNGDMCLGGRDLDEILVDHCIEKFRESSGVDLSLDKRARNRLQTSCETAKITLSTEFEATIRLLAIH